MQENKTKSQTIRPISLKINLYLNLQTWNKMFCTFQEKEQEKQPVVDKGQIHITFV